MLWEIKKTDYSLLKNRLICASAAIPEILLFMLWIVGKKKSSAA